MKRVLITASILICGLFIQPNFAHAQFDDNDPEAERPEFEGDETDVPFDGGASMLVASAIAYGVKVGAEKRKKKKEESPQ